MVERPPSSAKPASERREVPLMQRAYEKALETFEEQETIDPRSFVHFDQQMVERDLAHVEDMEARFAHQNSPKEREAIKHATILEAIIHDQVELNEWLGSEVTTRKTSRYDDIVNGVDSVAEFPEHAGPSYLALNLDVTSGPPDKKFARIRQEIDEGTLGSLKYFESSDKTFQRSLSMVPRVVIGVDKRQLARLADLWVNGKRRELAKDPVQIQILDEIALQLKAFQKYAEAQDKPAAVKAYTRMRSIVSAIAHQKQELRQQPSTQEALNRDLFYQQLNDTLQKAFE